MTHPPRKLSMLAIAIQKRSAFLNIFTLISSITNDGNMPLIVNLDQTTALQIGQ